jgi:amino acid transporter
MGFEGYSTSSQTVSELSAIDAPTRPLWVILALVYIMLFAAFGWGVGMSALHNRSLRIAGWLIILYVVINSYWPPMHLRGNKPTLTDTLHIVWAMVTILLMMLIMGFGAASLGRPFRFIPLLPFVVFVAFGILIGLEAPGIPNNLPTPRHRNLGAYQYRCIHALGNCLCNRFITQAKAFT